MDWEDEEHAQGRATGASALPDIKGPGVMLVIDTSGIHRVQSRRCGCDNAPPLDIQLLRMGLFPTSFDQVKTVITFRALEDQRLDNLECKTAMLHYWNKLRRKTSVYLWETLPVSAFPLGRKVPDEFLKNRYREFSRVSRMSRTLCNLASVMRPKSP
jgi:hypothetical protein